MERRIHPDSLGAGGETQEAFSWQLVMNFAQVSIPCRCLHLRSSSSIFNTLSHALPSQQGSVMVKLVALYKPAEDPAAFDQHYNDIHTPLVRKMPGLRKLEVSRITGAPIGEPKHYLMAEMYFDNQDAMTAALASPEGKATARDLMSFASTLVTMMYAEVND